MIEPNKRLIAWQTKTDTGRNKASLDALRQQMLENYRAAVTRLYDMEVKTRQVLDSAGVQAILYSPT
jgi:hypothetical protein